MNSTTYTGLISSRPNGGYWRYDIFYKLMVQSRINKTYSFELIIGKSEVDIRITTDSGLNVSTLFERYNRNRVHLVQLQAF